MNDWLKRCVFNLDLNRESVSEPERYQGGYSRVWVTNMKSSPSFSGLCYPRYYQESRVKLQINTHLCVATVMHYFQ